MMGEERRSAEAQSCVWHHLYHVHTWVPAPAARCTQWLYVHVQLAPMLSEWIVHEVKQLKKCACTYCVHAVLQTRGSSTVRKVRAEAVILHTKR